MSTQANKRWDFPQIPGLDYEIQNIYRLLNLKSTETYNEAVDVITTNTPAQGNDGEIQYNSGGSLAGDADLTWDDTGNVLTTKSLTTTGARVKSYETSTTTATMSDDKEIHICNGASDYTLTMPAHASGKVIAITNINSGIVTLSPTSGTVVGAATQYLIEGEILELISDGTNWELGG